MKPIFLTLGMTIALLSSSCKKSESEWVKAEVIRYCCATYLKIDNSYYKVCEGGNLLPEIYNTSIFPEIITLKYRSCNSCSDYYDPFNCEAADCINTNLYLKITAVK